MLCARTLHRDDDDDEDDVALVSQRDDTVLMMSFILTAAADRAPVSLPPPYTKQYVFVYGGVSHDTK